MGKKKPVAPKATPLSAKDERDLQEQEARIALMQAATTLCTSLRSIVDQVGSLIEQRKEDIDRSNKTAG